MDFQPLPKQRAQPTGCVSFFNKKLDFAYEMNYHYVMTLFYGEIKKKVKKKSHCKYITI